MPTYASAFRQFQHRARAALADLRRQIAAHETELRQRSFAWSLVREPLHREPPQLWRRRRLPQCECIRE